MSDRLQRGDLEKVVEEQVEFLAVDVIEYLLKEAKMGINGYTNVPPGELRPIPEDNPALADEAFRQARKRVAEGCTSIVQKHGHEVEQVCQKVDLADEHLQSNLEEALQTIWAEPRNWGRLISLFVAAFYMCKRLYGEGEKRKIDSVIGWLKCFIKNHAVEWVVERGGISGVLYGTTLPRTKADKQAAVVEDCKTDYAKTGLFMTALGLGAAVLVGTIIGR
jgi:hypothetical protein